MKKINEEFLQNYILSQNFDGSTIIESLLSFYKIFTTLEVKSVEDLKNSPKRYENFLMRNLHILQDYSGLSREQILSNIEYVSRSISAKIRGAISSYVADFSSIIKAVFPGQKDMHLLDVGSGIVPYSAFLEGESFSSVSTMDYDFFLPPETMQSLNVTGIKKLFDKHTPVTDYDAVVGKQPCSAIEHIAKTCAKENKPYLIQLCSCNLPNKSKYIDEWYGWQDVLPEFDPNIKFYEDYAFNLDANEEQVKKIIKQYLEKEEYEDVLSPEVFAKQMRSTPRPQYIIPSNLWLQPDESYEEPEPDEEKETDFLQMELFERS